MMSTFNGGTILYFDSLYPGALNLQLRVLYIPLRASIQVL